MDHVQRLKKTNRTLMIIMAVTLAVFGVALVYFSMRYLEGATVPPPTSPADSGHPLGMFVLVITMLGGLPAVGFGAYVMYVGSRILATRQWPPAGMGWRAPSPVMLGTRAGWVGGVVMVLGFLLIAVGLSLPWLGWRLSEQW
jgi:hypothetical protein